MPSKNTITDEVPLTIFVPKELKKQLGAIAAIEETSLKAITNEALNAWLKGRMSAS
jgi:hypothetical protein